MRRTLIVLHRWVGLAVGVVLFVIAVSGTTLVFENAIDRALNPTLWNVAATGPILALDTLVSRVERSAPGRSAGSMSLSSQAGRAWTANVSGLTIFFSPYTGAITGSRTPQESQASFARRLHVLHVELFAGPIGRSIVGAVSGIALLLVISGMTLWWRDKLLRVQTRASWKRINFDLHHAAGILASLVLIVITASGLVVHYDGLSKAIQSLDAAPTPPPPKQPDLATPASAKPSFEAIATTARHALPGADVMFIALGTKSAPATVAMRFPEDRTPGGRSRVFINRYTNMLLGVTSTRDAHIGTRLDNLKRSLHTGDILGPVTRAVWFMATLFLTAQIVTGTLMWWNARPARKSSRHTRPSP